MQSQINVCYCYSSSSLFPQTSKGDFKALGFSVSANLKLKHHQSSYRLTGLNLPLIPAPFPSQRLEHEKKTQFLKDHQQHPQDKLKCSTSIDTDQRVVRALLRWDTPALAGAQCSYKLITTSLKSYISLDECKAFNIFSMKHYICFLHREAINLPQVLPPADEDIPSRIEKYINPIPAAHRGSFTEQGLSDTDKETAALGFSLSLPFTHSQPLPYSHHPVQRVHGYQDTPRAQPTVVTQYHPVRHIRHKKHGRKR